MYKSLDKSRSNFVIDNISLMVSIQSNFDAHKSSYNERYRKRWFWRHDSVVYVDISTYDSR